MATKLNSATVRGACKAFEVTKRLAEMFTDLGFDPDNGLALVSSGVITQSELGKLLAKTFFGKPVSFLRHFGLRQEVCLRPYTVGDCLEALESAINDSVHSNWVTTLRNEKHVRTSLEERIDVPDCSILLLPVRRTLSARAALRLCLLRGYHPVPPTAMLWIVAYVAKENVLSTKVFQNVGVYTLASNPRYLHEEWQLALTEEHPEIVRESEWFGTEKGLFANNKGHTELPGTGQGTYSNQRATSKQCNYLLVRRKC